MMKKLSTSFAFLLFAGMAVANPVGVDEAMQLAYGFYQKQSGASGMPSGFELTLAYSGKGQNGGVLLSGALSSEPAFYVFNKPENSGFIIVSGESETADILGYSDNGAFVYENIPDNFRAWLDACEAAVAGVRAGAGEGAVSYAPFEAGDYPDAVEPLLGGIMWDQSDPYNLLCPDDPKNGGRSVTGCVATAMAQIMRYHQWPAKGKGMCSYTTNTLGIPMSVSFSRSEYDWENMTETYDSNSTEEERQAVALLMRDCGVSVYMDYTSIASGAQSSNVGIALTNYFSYDENLQIYDREYYHQEVWLDMLRGEISAGRPVYYSGTSIGGGHAFVCDGYDANGLFHFNWGWSGLSNGYFDVTILDPSSQGIGAGSGGYSFQQYIITGIQKPSEDTEPVELVCLSSPVVTEATRVQKGETFTIQFGMRNRGLQEMMPRFGFALYKDEELYSVLNTTEFATGLPFNYGKDDLTLDVSVPTSASDGMYRIYPVYRDRNVGDWKIMKGKVGCQSYLDVNVEGNVVKISSSSPSYVMSVENMEMTELYSGNAARVKMDISNTGDEEYVGVFLIYLINNDASYMVLLEGLDIMPGETYALDKKFTVNAPVGEYSLYVYYDKLRDGYIYPIAWEDYVSVESMPACEGLELLDDIYLDNDKLVAGDELVLNANIRSAGGPYYNKLFAYVYESGSYSTPLFSFNEIVFLEDNREPSEVKLSSIVNLEPGNYRVDLWGYQNNEFIKPTGATAFCVFEVLGSGVGEESAAFEATVSPAGDMLYVECESGIESVTVYSLSGAQKMVSYVAGAQNAELQMADLSSGIYIVKVATADGCFVKKIVKE